MDAQQPGLFNLPDQPEPNRPERLQRGRNRETWARIVSAEVTVVDALAVQDAVAAAEANAVVLEVFDTAEDAELGSELAPTVEPFDCLAWLIWPTDGLQELLEAAAFRVIDVDIAVTPESKDNGTITWTVTAKLTDVDQLRRLAVQNHPDEQDSIMNSLAVAWHHAADPFRPLDSIPGIIWKPGQVDVEHLQSRATRNR